MKSTLFAVLLSGILFVACKKSDSPAPPAKTVPTVTTTVVTNITGTSALSGGTIVSPGSSPVIQMGVAWSNQPTPFDNGSHTGAGFFANSGSYNCTLTPLTPNTTYYYQAYAANENGFGKGAVLTFKTP